MDEESYLFGPDDDEFLSQVGKSNDFYGQLENPIEKNGYFIAHDFRDNDGFDAGPSLQDRIEERTSYPVTAEPGPVPMQDMPEERVTYPERLNYSIIDMPSDVGAKAEVPAQDRIIERVKRPPSVSAPPPAGLRPSAPAAASEPRADKPGLLSRLLGGEGTQSNGRPVIDNGQINWGDPQNPADFFRADAAMRKMQGGDTGGSSAPRARVGDRMTPPGNIPNDKALNAVDPRLRRVLNEARSALPAGYTMQFTSGMRQKGQGFHPKGQAVDVVLVDPDGKRLPNYQDAKYFDVYESFAKAVRQKQQELYPELDKALRWGGYFSGEKGKYGAFDLMHFDLGGDRVPMGGGSWDGGLTPAQRRLWGISGREDGGRVELLEDKYPTHYLPHVGRQVMNGGGDAEKDEEADLVNFALSKLEPFELDVPAEAKRGVELSRKEVLDILNKRTSGDERDPHMPSGQESPGMEDFMRANAMRSAGAKAPNIAALRADLGKGEEARGRVIQAGPYIDVGGGITMPVKDFLLMLDANAGKVPGTSMKPNASVAGGLRMKFDDGGVAEKDKALRVAQEVMTDPMGVAAVAAIEQQPEDARPGLYEKLTDILSSPFRTYAEKTKEAAQSGSALMSESAKSLRGEEGRLPINAVWQYPLGAAATVLSPLTGATETIGEGVAQATGNKAIGERAAFAAGMADPSKTGQLIKSATRTGREVLESAAPKLMDRAPSLVDNVAAKADNVTGAIPESEGLNYVTRQDGPFYRIQRTTSGEVRSGDSGLREGVRDQDWPTGSLERGTTGSVGDGATELPARKSVQEIVGDPELNKPLQYARQYAEGRGISFAGKVDMPPSSLAKQSAIGRTFQLAAEGSPEYKQAVFDAYVREMPEVIRQSGAQNYDELVAASYRQMAKETADQFDSLPLSYSFHRAGEGNYPSSAEMVRDVHGNNHLYVFQGGDRHDFLHNVDPRTGLNENEKFRAVHDAYGHAIYGNKFGAPGEETAWGIHQQMYSPLARLAMTSETRGQNSFVNYSPANALLMERIHKLEEGIADAKRYGFADKAKELQQLKMEAYNGLDYAPQKSVILPPEMVRTDYAGGMPAYLSDVNKPTPGTSVASDLTHFSHKPGLEELDPSRYGTGIPGDEASRLRSTPGGVKERSYFYMGTPDRVTPEEGLGPHKYVARSENLYDLTKDPLNFKVLAREANRSPWEGKFNPGTVDAGRYMNDLERLVKEYGYEGFVNPNAAFPMGVTFEKTPVRQVERRGGQVVDRALELTRHFGSDINQVAKKVRT